MPSKNQRLRIAVLASGEGTTLQTMLDAGKKDLMNGYVVTVISNNRDSGALRRAKSAAVPAVYLSSKTHSNPDALDQAMLDHLEAARADLVVLAGFMKKIGPRTLAAFGSRMLNTHPALLPKFGGKGMYGRRVHEAVLAAGETKTGVTIHRVDGDYDHGAVLAQTAVAVEAGDTPDTLAARVQAAERSLLVEVINSLQPRVW